MVLNGGPNLHFAETLREIIEKNLDDPTFSIEKLCQTIGLSRSQLHRRLKAATSLSPSLFIRQVRMQSARNLLVTTDLTIAEVSYQCGISSPQNFTKYFTAEFGVNPSDFRKKLRASEPPQNEASPDLTALHPHKPLSVEVVPPPPQPRTRAEKVPKSRKKVAIFLLIAGVVAMAALVARMVTSPNPLRLSPYADTSSVAVIPFKNYYTTDNDFLGEGVVEDILTHLTRFKNIRVLSRTSTERYGKQEKSVRQIASELGVKYVLEGSIRQSEGMIRITAQLIDAEHDRHVWAKNYDRPKANVMEIQGEVALDIARSLKQEISPDLKRTLTQLPTHNAEAYRALLRGRHLLRTREKEALEASLYEFDEALRLDPHLSAAYTGKAAAYYLLQDSYFNDQTAQYLPEAEKHALRAIKEDSNNAQAFAYLGLVYKAQYRWEEAYTVLTIALDLNPSDALINYWYGNFFRATGRLDEALKYQRIAHELDPMYPVIHAGYGFTCILAGRYELAEQLLDQGKLIFKSSFLQQTTRGYLHLFQGEYASAIEDLNQGLSQNPDFGLMKSGKLYCQGKLGRRSVVEAYLDTLDTHQPNACLRAAVAYLGLDEPEKSVEMLRQAADLNRIDTDILNDHRYQPILYHPTVLQILQEFGLRPYLPARP